MTPAYVPSFEEKFRRWNKEERVVLKAYPHLEGLVEDEAVLYPFVLWPGQDRAYAIHTDEILPYQGPPEAQADEGEPTHLILYRGTRYSGLSMAMSASSFTLAQELSHALTAATGNPHWVEPVEDVVRTETNRVYWKP